MYSQEYYTNIALLLTLLHGLSTFNHLTDRLCQEGTTKCQGLLHPRGRDPQWLCLHPVDSCDKELKGRGELIIDNHLIKPV